MAFLDAQGAALSDEETEPEQRIDFNSAVDGWQYVSAGVTAPADFASVRITLVNRDRMVPAQFDSVRLSRGVYGYNYYYKDNGALNYIEEIPTPAVTPEEEETAGSGEEENASSETEEPENRSESKTVSSMGITGISRYDNYGNMVESSITNGRVSIREKSLFTSNGNYLTAAVDPLGNTTQYQFNDQTGNLESVTNAEGDTVSYTYNSLGGLTGMRQDVTGLAGGDNISVTYSYDQGDRLSTINHNNFAYTFQYDAFGVLRSVKAGGNTLVSYAYDDDYMPASTTYGNSQTIYYTYDGNSQLIGISTEAKSGLVHTSTAI